jgi:7-cyano-7-deazaguanine synthase
MAQKMAQNRNKAVVLLSGGLDSATMLALALDEGYACHAMSFRYGQRHEVEVDAAMRIARNMGVAAHHIVDIDLTAFGGSALTTSLDVPKHLSADEIGGGIPITYVPARNTIFLSYALAWAEVLGANDIFIGVNALDYSGYPDCRPAYIAAYENMARLATRAGVEGGQLNIRAPLIAMSKAQIIQAGLRLGVDYAEAMSCYDPEPGGSPCGRCDACLLRAKGFAEAGVRDPLLVRFGRHLG